MDIKDYLKKCHVTSVKQLTDEQVKQWFLSDDADVQSHVAFDMAYNAPSHVRPPENHIMKYARLAMESGKTLCCTYVQPESANGEPEKDTSGVWLTVSK